MKNPPDEISYSKQKRAKQAQNGHNQHNVTVDELEDLLSRSSKNFPGKNPDFDDPDVIMMWFEVLRAYSTKDIRQAIVHYFKLGTFFPSCADLLKVLNKKNQVTAPAGSEFAKIWHALTEGPHWKRTWNDVTQEILNRMGGIQFLQDTATNDKKVWMEKDFTKQYEDLSKDVQAGIVELKKPIAIAGNVLDLLDRARSQTPEKQPQKPQKADPSKLRQFRLDLLRGE